MKGSQIAAQFLEVIAGRDTQILIRRRIVDHLEFAEQAAFEIRGMFVERTRPQRRRATNRLESFRSCRNLDTG